MKKMSEQDVLDFIEGRHLVEFIPLNLEEENKVLEYLKGGVPFHATKDGTYKVHPEVFQDMIAKGFKLIKLD